MQPLLFANCLIRIYPAGFDARVESETTDRVDQISASASFIAIDHC